MLIIIILIIHKRNKKKKMKLDPTVSLSYHFIFHNCEI